MRQQSSAKETRELEPSRLLQDPEKKPNFSCRGDEQMIWLVSRRACGSIIQELADEILPLACRADHASLRETWRRPGRNPKVRPAS